MRQYLSYTQHFIIFILQFVIHDERRVRRELFIYMCLLHVIDVRHINDNHFKI